MFINHLFLFSGVLYICSSSGVILLSFAASNVNCISAHPAYRIWRYFTTRDISTHLLVLVNIFTKAVIHLPLFFAQLTLILSFQLPIASCCDLVHCGSWTGCIWWKGRLLSQPLAWIGILISIHYYQRISTPSPSRVWHSPRQMKNAHSPCALMCFSMHATH